MYTMYVPSIHGGQKRAPYALELEFPMVASCYMGIEKQAYVLPRAASILSCRDISSPNYKFNHNHLFGSVPKLWIALTPDTRLEMAWKEAGLGLLTTSS